VDGSLNLKGGCFSLTYCTLGIDPGSNYTGWAVLENESGKVVRSGCISVGSKVKGYKRRITSIANILEGILYGLEDEGFKLTHAAIESQFVSFNPSSTITLSRATGALIFVIYRVTGVIAEDVAPRAAKSVFDVAPKDYEGTKYQRRKQMGKDMKQVALERYNVKCKRDDEAFAIAIAEVIRGKHLDEAKVSKAK
jgi:Holliday junction resolvasome RuvABC endonuclease subunit